MEIRTPEQIPIMQKLLADEASKALSTGGKFYFDYGAEKKPNTYTSKQRGALHVFCREYSKALNDAGFLRRKVLLSKPKTFMQKIKSFMFDGEESYMIEVDWTEAAFKEDVYKVVLKALKGKGSTENQSTIDPTEVADHINRHFGQTKGITIPWPSLR